MGTMGMLFSTEKSKLMLANALLVLVNALLMFFDALVMFFNALLVLVTAYEVTQIATILNNLNSKWKEISARS